MVPPEVVPSADSRQTPNARAWRRFRRNRVAVASGWYLAIVLVLVLVWPLFRLPLFESQFLRGLRHAPNALSDRQFEPPGPDHWFGTDVHGRDLLSRITAGARISLLVGAVGALVSLVIGVLWGATAGYVGGRWDSFMMRVVDVLYSLPSIVFVIVLITTLEQLFKDWLTQNVSSSAGAGVRLLFLFVGLGAVSWLTMSRIVRGQVLSLRARSFIDASRVLGASHARILFRHILPNTFGVIITYLTLTVPSIILYESFLSYLGLGIQPPQASLGSLIAEGASQINPVHIYWWVILFPAGLLTSILLALTFVGDGLRDAFDPKS